MIAPEAFWAIATGERIRQLQEQGFHQLISSGYQLFVFFRGKDTCRMADLLEHIGVDMEQLRRVWG